MTVKLNDFLDCWLSGKHNKRTRQLPRGEVCAKCHIPKWFAPSDSAVRAVAERRSR